MHSGHHHHQSLREQLQFTNVVPQSTATTPGAPRTIFGRLGIRKPSILSLSSPQPPGGATARTFSLDDLLRPPPRRKADTKYFRNSFKNEINDFDRERKFLLITLNSIADLVVSLDTHTKKIFIFFRILDVLNGQHQKQNKTKKIFAKFV